MFNDNQPDETDQNGDTALHLAAKLQNAKIVAMLTVFEADPTLKNNEEQTPLDIATEQQDECTQVLLGGTLSFPVPEIPDENDEDEADEVKQVIEVDKVGAGIEIVYATNTEDKAVQTATFELPIHPIPMSKRVGFEEFDDEEPAEEVPEPEPYDRTQAKQQLEAEWTLTRSALISHKWSTRNLHLPAEIEENKETAADSMEIQVTSADPLEDADAQLNQWFLKHYGSEDAMLDDEKIDSLQSTKYTVTMKNVLKDPTEYKLPEDRTDRFHLERDLRKLKIGLLRIHKSQPRKLAKLAILKHYDLLTSIYKKYCKIGGDQHWMTFNGWIQLMKDVRLVKKVQDAETRIYCEIFDDVYQYHHEHQHVYNENKKHGPQLSGLYGGVDFQDPDPWTGTRTVAFYVFTLFLLYILTFFEVRHLTKVFFDNLYSRKHLGLPRANVVDFANKARMPGVWNLKLCLCLFVVILSDDVQTDSKRFAKSATVQNRLLFDCLQFDFLHFLGIWCLEKDKAKIEAIEKRLEMLGSDPSFRFGMGPPSLLKQKTTEKQNKDRYDKYKIRKYGDVRVMGCMNDMTHADIGGGLLKANYKKAKLEIRFKKRRIHNAAHQRRIWNCEIHPPEDDESPITMTVNWEEHNKKASNRVKKGTLRLYKHSQIANEDEDLSESRFHGLSKHEFLDAILLVASVVNNNNERDKNELYQMVDDFASRTLTDYIYNNITELRKFMRGKKISDDVRFKLKQHPAIMRLFKKYASLRQTRETETLQINLGPRRDSLAAPSDGDLKKDQWVAMAIELCDAGKSMNKDLWKRGGRPKQAVLEHCFTLCKDSSMLTVDEIGKPEFERCLMFFTAEIFKYQPSVRYDVLQFERKLDMVLEWAERLDAKKKMRKVGRGKTIRSETFRRMGTMETERANINDGLFVNNLNAMDTLLAASAAGTPVGSNWGDSQSEHSEHSDHSAIHDAYFNAKTIRELDLSSLAVKK